MSTRTTCHQTISYYRLVGRLPKFSPITAYMRDVLHWLPISQWIQYRITALVSWCVIRCAPSYLRDLCCPVSVLAARRVLRSAAMGELLVPRARLAIMQRRAFSVVGPSAWNDLPVRPVESQYGPGRKATMIDQVPASQGTHSRISRAVLNKRPDS